MKFKKELMLVLAHQEYNPGKTMNEDSRIKVIESTDWEGGGKYQDQSVIFEFEGKFYELYQSRSGSYYSDYWHDREDWGDEVECQEVEPYEITTTKWRKKSAV